MRASSIRSALLAVLPALVMHTGTAHAAPPSKEECVDAHGKGQDARESGQLVRAGKLFLTCAQSTCPDLVLRDCARFAEEVERQTPTITFAARDGAQRDLPDTRVFVDGQLAASQLGDGRAYEIDPGRHEVRFTRGADEVVVTIVVSQGEKGRAVVGTFAPLPSAKGEPALPALHASREPSRPSGPLVLAGIGGAVMAAGGVLLGVGLAKMPSGCSLATHTCTGPSDDPSLGNASRAVTFVNTGAIVGGAGAAMLAGGLIWYFAQPVKRPQDSARWAPWVGAHGAGIAMSGSF